MYISICWTIK